MNKLSVSCWGVLVLAGSCCFGGEARPFAAVSPDGRNEIRLWPEPLSYEVRRGGKVVAAKTAIGMKVDGACLSSANVREVRRETRSGEEATPVYKKAKIDLAANETFVDFGAWGVRLAARNDGVAYRFETKLPGKVRVDCEKAAVTVPSASARCWVNFTDSYGCEETIPAALPAGEVRTASTQKGRSMAYLPFAYAADGAFVVVTESDVRDYPVWNLVGTNAVAGSVRLDAKFAGWPKQVRRIGGWGKQQVERGGRWVRIDEHEDFLVKATSGMRTFPWRAFILADAPSKVCEADIVRALAAPQAEGDFSWVKPGKVAWDWWNCFDNSDPKAKNGGCTTKTYERFIDFAAATGVEYVIFDEGWSESLNIWKFHPEVDVPHLIDYANKKDVGIILWMAWAQVYGEEEKVAEHFSRLGAKGFKVDFMDRGDAEVANFLERFAAACAKHRMLVDYHGVYRPVGLQRKYPNVVNYEGIHGLEQLKWFPGGAAAETAMMASDVRAFYLRLSAGPMDYTPGAMLNHAVGAGYKGSRQFPGSVGTRCRQMAMMALYEAPLQMLCDSPTNYERNRECFDFMARTPVVWADTVGVGGDPDSIAAVARKANDGSWYAAGITDVSAREFALDTAFLGDGTWRAEIFRDGPDADKNGASYVHERDVAVKAGSKLRLRLAPGGGFVVRFVR